MDSKRIKDDITGRKVWQVIVRDTIWTSNPVIASVFSSEGDAEMFADNECLKLFKASECEYSEVSHAIDKNRLLENISAFHHIDFMKFIKARLVDDDDDEETEETEALWYTVLDFVKESPKVSLHTFIDWEESSCDPPYHVTIEEVRIK